MSREDSYNIKELYKEILIEGYFHVPEHIIKDIKDYYIDIFKKFHKAPTKEVSDKLYPPKIFYIDFNGTNFEFLNLVKPKPTLYVYFSEESSQFSAYNNYTQTNTLVKKNQGNIRLQLIDDLHLFKRMTSEIVEHEVMHYIQYLLHVYKNPLAGSTHSNQFKSNVDFSGHSYTTDLQRRKKVRHDWRPSEYYTNLMSAMRELQHIYHDRFHEKRDWILFRKLERPRIHFFRKFLDVVNGEIEDPELEETNAVDSFRQFQKLSPELYQKMLKLAYRAFVMEEPNFDPEVINDLIKDIENQ